MLAHLLALLLGLLLAQLLAGALGEHCDGGACWPGREACVRDDKERPPVQPAFHLMDDSCGENDPNAPFFDPVHGVMHFFHQKVRRSLRLRCSLSHGSFFLMV